MRSLFLLILGATGIVAPVPACAQESSLLQDAAHGIVRIIAGLQEFLGPLEILIYVIAWLTGAAMMIIGISLAAQRADQGPGRGGWGGPVTCLVAGAALLALPTLLDTLTRSLFPQDEWSAVTVSIFATAPHLTQVFEEQVTQETIVAILQFVQLVGILAVFRGILLLNAAVDRRATVGAGLTHLAGGALAINIGPVLAIIDGLVT